MRLFTQLYDRKIAHYRQVCPQENARIQKVHVAQSRTCIAPISQRESTFVE
jgi:hypothetical protein